MTNPEETLLEQMRAYARRRRDVTPNQDAPLSIGARAADMVASVVGSWRFILIQSTLLGIWLVWNAASGRAFDPYPFILLNLVLSFQAAYTAPMIMMSQNRQSELDRRRAIEDFDINRKAEMEIELLHEKMDLMREREIARLTDSVDRLTRMLEAKG